jgi:hypothetical protein
VLAAKPSRPFRPRPVSLLDSYPPRRGAIRRAPKHFSGCTKLPATNPVVAVTFTATKPVARASSSGPRLFVNTSTIRTNRQARSRPPVAAADRGGRRLRRHPRFQWPRINAAYPSAISPTAREATPQPGNTSIFIVNLELTVPHSSVKVFSPGLCQFFDSVGDSGPAVVRRTLGGFPCVYAT